VPAGDTKPVSPSPGNLQAVREGMMGTMRPGGSGARAAAGAPYTIAGKTGTAQVISRRGTAAVNPKSLPMHLRHRSLFVGFAPAENPVIAVAIAVEGGGYGGSAAAPIARKLFDAWLLGKMPDGLEPLDSERGTTAIGIAGFESSDNNARAAGDAAAAVLESLPIQVGLPVAPAPVPSPVPGAPVPAATAPPTAPERSR
jgi:penicillin-binding protein 2